MLTAAQLKAIMPYTTMKLAALYAPFLSKYMAQYGIDTPLRQCHFLAQLAVESGSLVYTKEIASGEAYNGRRDLGNINPGDGPRYKGRGLIQLTGRANYQKFQDTTGLQVVAHPELLEQPENAVLVSVWYWKRHNLNEWADKDDITTVTKKINGGLRGFDRRKQYLSNAKKVLL